MGISTIVYVVTVDMKNVIWSRCQPQNNYLQLSAIGDCGWA
jgi:hypothetical protein